MGSKDFCGAVGPLCAGPQPDGKATQGLWFSIEIGSDEFVAFISAAALLMHFGAGGCGSKQLLAAYRRHQQAIDATARRHFLAGAARPIRLGIDDFPSM